MIGLDFNNATNFINQYSVLSKEQLIYLWKQSMFKDNLKATNSIIQSVILNSIYIDCYEEFFTKDIIELVIDNSTLFNIITNNDEKSLKFTGLKNFKDVLLSKDDDFIRNIMTRSIIIDDELLEILEPAIGGYSKINNAITYRFVMDNLYNGNNSEMILDQIEEDRKIEIFEMLNEKNDLSIDEVRELVADYLFQDTMNNIINFINIICEKLDNDEEFVNDIGYDNVMIIKEFLDKIYSTDKKELINYLNKNKDINIRYLIKDTLKEAYEVYEENICNELTNLNNINNLDGNPNIKILNGQEFNFIVKKMSLEELQNSELIRTITLLDYMNSDNLTNYLYDQGLVFGFLDINKDDINNISDTEEPIFNQKIYKRRIILEKNHRNIQPNFIITYNDLNQDVINIANITNMPIVIIDTVKYSKRGV